MKVACMLEQDTYKPGDLPPEGYLAWHEWAEVQRKAGIKQSQCGKCGLWRTPQELSGQTMRWTAQSRKGQVEQTAPICSKCVAPNDQHNRPASAGPDGCDCETPNAELRGAAIAASKEERSDD